MEKLSDQLKSASSELEEIIRKNNTLLDSAQQDLESQDPDVVIPQAQIVIASAVVALERMKHKLATLQGGLKAADCQDTILLNNIHILNNLARAWQTRSCTELQEILLEEKRKQILLAEEINRKNDFLNEYKELIEILLKEKTYLESIREELEIQKISRLEEKLAKARRLNGEMKIHLKETIEIYFPDPKVTGFTSMYALLNELTQRLQHRERDAYIEIQTTVWPYYLETLERYGIIERHPTDRKKMRIIDFSDGRLGS